MMWNPPWQGARGFGGYDFEAREDVEELGVGDNIDTLNSPVNIYGNEAYHWTKSKAKRDAMLKKGLGQPGQYMLESHELPEAYTELSAESRRWLVERYGSVHDAVSERAQIDLERLYKRDNPTWSRVWVTGSPETAEGSGAMRSYGPYGVRIRLADWFYDNGEPWGLAVTDSAYGWGLTLTDPIPPEYLEPVDG